MCTNNKTAFHICKGTLMYTLHFYTIDFTRYAYADVEEKAV